MAAMQENTSIILLWSYLLQSNTRVGADGAGWGTSVVQCGG